MERIVAVSMRNGCDIITVNNAVHIGLYLAGIQQRNLSPALIQFCISLAGHMWTTSHISISLCSWKEVSVAARKYYWKIAIILASRPSFPPWWLHPFINIFDNYSLQTRNGLYFSSIWFLLTRLILNSPISVQCARPGVLLCAIMLLHRRKALRGQKMDEARVFYNRLRWLAYRTKIPVRQLLRQLSQLRHSNK